MKDLKIGDWVRFCTSVIVGYEGGYDRKVIETKREYGRRGQIVGIAVRYIGTCVPGSNCFGDYDPSYLENTKRLQFWEVKLGMTNKPLLVRDEDIVVASYQEGKIPIQHQELTLKYRHELAEIMREEMADRPRDEYGRWLKDGSNMANDAKEEVSR